MAEVARLEDRPLHPKTALQRARVLWERGEVIVLGHAQERMRQRGLTMIDLEHLILRSGRMYPTSKTLWAWRYKIEGRTAEKRNTAFILELTGKLVVVTALR